MSHNPQLDQNGEGQLFIVVFVHVNTAVNASDGYIHLKDRQRFVNVVDLNINTVL